MENQDPAVQQAQVAQGFCPAVQQNCVGINQQYSDVDDCINQLSNKTFGTFDEVWGDNVVCRQIHVVLTTIRPEVSQGDLMTSPVSSLVTGNLDVPRLYVTYDLYMILSIIFQSKSIALMLVRPAAISVWI